MNGRPWTKPEIDQALALRGQVTTVAIAALLNRSLSSTYQLFFKRGLTKPRWTARERRALKVFIRAKHAQEWSDAEIAVGWSKLHPDRTVDRGWVSEVRREQLQIRSHGNRTSRYRRRVARTTREQLQRAGLCSLGDLRTRAYEQFAVSFAWAAT